MGPYFGSRLRCRGCGYEEPIRDKWDTWSWVDVEHCAGCEPPKAAQEPAPQTYDEWCAEGKSILEMLKRRQLEMRLLTAAADLVEDLYQRKLDPRTQRLRDALLVELQTWAE